MTDIVFNGDVQLAGWRESHNTGATVTFWLENQDDLKVFKSMVSKRRSSEGQRLLIVAVIAPEIQDCMDYDDKVVQPEESKDVVLPESQQNNFEGLSIKGGKLSKLAAMLGRHELFPSFLLENFDRSVSSQKEIAETIRMVCKVTSRAELDHNPEAAKLFHQKIRLPFIAFFDKFSRIV